MDFSIIWRVTNSWNTAYVVRGNDLLITLDKSGDSGGSWQDFNKVVRFTIVTPTRVLTLFILVIIFPAFGTEIYGWMKFKELCTYLV